MMASGAQEHLDNPAGLIVEAEGTDEVKLGATKSIVIDPDIATEIGAPYNTPRTPSSNPHTGTLRATTTRTTAACTPCFIPTSALAPHMRKRAYTMAGKSVS
jgi:hypothetical protein